MERIAVDETVSFRTIIRKYFTDERGFEANTYLFDGSIKWKYSDGIFVEENSTIGWLTFNYDDYHDFKITQKEIEKSMEIELYTPTSGFLDIKFLFWKSFEREISFKLLNEYSEKTDEWSFIIDETLRDTNLIFTVNENESDIWDKYTDLYEYNIVTDDFTGEKTIEWHNHRNQIYINGLFQIKRIDNDDCLFVKTSDKYEIGTTLSFLFTDGTVRSFPLREKPVKKDNIYSLKFVLFEDDLVAFSTKFVKACRIYLPNKESKDWFSLPIERKDKNFYKDEQNFFRFFTMAYMKAMKKVYPNWKPKLSPAVEEKSDVEVKTNKDEQVYVYMMIDYNTNYHKIGISNKPKFREHTLQSEKPTIDMLCCKSFPNRKIAQAIESALHSVYSDKRVRGEWFELNEKDVFDLKNTLK